MSPTCAYFGCGRARPVRSGAKRAGQSGRAARAVSASSLPSRRTGLRSYATALPCGAAEPAAARSAALAHLSQPQPCRRRSRGPRSRGVLAPRCRPRSFRGALAPPAEIPPVPLLLAGRRAGPRCHDSHRAPGPARLPLRSPRAASRGVSRGQRPPPAAGSAAAAPAPPARRSPVAGETARVLPLAAAAEGPGDPRGGGSGRGPRSSASWRRRGPGRGDRGAARGRGVILLLSGRVLLCGLPEVSGPPSAFPMAVPGQRTARGRARGFCRVRPGAVRERSGPMSQPWRPWGCCLTGRGSGCRVCVRCQAVSKRTWGHKL